MSRMLLSINPEHVRNILSGEKRYEFRKVRCRSSVDKIIIYATRPIMKVVAEADVLNVIEGSVDEVWSVSKGSAGITQDFFYSYFKGKERAIAYHLGDVEKYAEPKTLVDFGIHTAPQSFVYV